MPHKTTTKVLALSLGKGLTTVATIGSAMLMSRILTEAQLGTYRQSILAYDMVTNIFCLGIVQGVYYFLPAEKVRSRGVVLDGLIVLFAMGILSGSLLFGARFFLAEQFSNPELKATLSYLAILPVVMMPASLIASVMVTQDKVPQLTVYNISSNLILVGSMILSCWYWKSPASILISKVLVDILFSFVAILLMYRALPKDEWRPNLKTIRSMIAFSLPLGMAALFGMFQVNLDRLLVSLFCTPEQFAIYSNGALEIPFIGIVTASIATVIQPELRRKIAVGLKFEAVNLFRLSAEKSAVMLIPIMVFLFVCAEPLMILLFSEKYVGSAVPFRIYLLLLPARIVLYGSMMVALGLSRTVLYRTAAAALANLCLGYWFVAWLGAPGAAVATVLSTFFFACGWSLWAIAQAVPCSFWELLPYRKIVGLFFLSVVASLPSLVLRTSQSVESPAIELLISFFLFCITLVIVAVCFKNELLLNTWKQTKSYLASRFDSF